MNTEMIFNTKLNVPIYSRGEQVNLSTKQESHPAWTQEALSPDQSSPNGRWYPHQVPKGWRVPHPVLTGGKPHQEEWYIPLLRKNGIPPSRRMGYHLSRRMGVSPIGKDGVPLSGLDGGTPPLSAGGVPPSPKIEQTHTCEKITSRHPSDAGGNKQDFIFGTVSNLQHCTSFLFGCFR